jgi:hypothetical protein
MLVGVKPTLQSKQPMRSTPNCRSARSQTVESDKLPTNRRWRQGYALRESKLLTTVQPSVTHVLVRRLPSCHYDSGAACRPWPLPYNNLDIASQQHQEPHQSFERETG